MGTDPDCHPRIVRLSIGVEELEVRITAMTYVRPGSPIYATQMIGFEGRSQSRIAVSRHVDCGIGLLKDPTSQKLMCTLPQFLNILLRNV